MSFDEREYEIIKLKLEKELLAFQKAQLEEMVEAIEERIRYAIKDMITAEQQKCYIEFVKRSEFSMLWQREYDDRLERLEENVNRKATLLKSISTIVITLGGVCGVIYGILVRIGVI